MTNTRITDPEIMERRYPVVLREFSLRDGSEGKGKFDGGRGVVRDIEFLSKEIQVSILSERRVFAPYGLAGGGDGQSGLNIWVKKEEETSSNAAGERRINLGGKTTVKFKRGDRIIVNTPGGGGWGAPEADKNGKEKGSNTHAHVDRRQGSLAEREAASLGA